MIESVGLFSRDQTKFYRIGAGAFGYSVQVYDRVSDADEDKVAFDATTKVTLCATYEEALDEVLELLSGGQ